MERKHPTFREWLKAKLRDLYHQAGEPVPDVDKCPLKAPWPPGMQMRVVQHPLHGNMLQLRDGAALPHEWHEMLRIEASRRFAGSYSLN